MIPELALSLALLAGAAQDPAKDIKSKDVQKRLVAIEQLAATDSDDAEKPLVGALKDKDWEVQEKAARALAAAGGEKSLKALVDVCLKGPTERVRRVAARSLAEIDADGANAALIKKLSGKTSRRACEALALVALASGKPFDVSKLRKLLKDKDPDLQVLAQRAVFLGVGHQGNEKEFAAALATALKNPSVRLQAVALEGVAEVGSYPLALTVWQHLDQSPGPVIERRILRAVRAGLLAADAPGSAEEALANFVQIAGATDHAESLARLIHLLAGTDQFGKEALRGHCTAARESSTSSTRSAAATALGAIGDEESVSLLHGLGEDSEVQVRRAALLALARCVDLSGEESAAEIKWLCERLKADTDPIAREMIVVRLGVRDLEGADTALYEASEDADWSVRVCATVSIGKLGKAAHVAQLVSIGQAADWRMRGAAAVGLAHVLKAEAVLALIPMVEDEERLVARSAWGGLHAVSGREDLGFESSAWEKWWEENKGRIKFRDPKELEERRKRYGYSVSDADIYEGLDVIVLESRGDHVEKLLTRLEVEHRMTQGAKVDEVGLHQNAVFFANCTGEVEDSDVERMAWFVRVGGSLFSSCWALHETVERIYPGVLRKHETMHDVLDNVAAAPCSDSSPYLTGVFPEGVKPVYHLEGAHLIEVIDRERAQVLIDSPEAAERHGSGELAAWFQAGHGVIMDSVNHFDLQGLENAVWLKSAEDRQAWAIDHMGLAYDRWRETRKEKFWGNALKAAREIEDLSAFRFVTNFVRAKRVLGD